MPERNEARKKALRAEYVGRINRVLDYIEANLTGDLSLATLARVANFSPFHFHRIFRSIIGETLNQFIQRRRLEKAASSLLANAARSITEIALDCGFSGSSTFARAFKDAFGVSASEYRAAGCPGQSKNGNTKSKENKAESKLRQDVGLFAHTIDLVSGTQLWRCTMTSRNEVNITVKDMPEMHVAYVRHIGPYKGNAALFERLFGKLCGWAGPRGLIRPPETQFLCLYYDDPDVTDEQKQRVDVAITVAPETEVEGEIGKNLVAGGRYAVGRFELLPTEYEQAWATIMGGWLPESGYQCDDKPCYELYHNDPKTHPEGRCIVDICIPVKPL
jgi:AraC family transcriptional regulator